MKLRYKILLSTGLVWLTFLVITVALGHFLKPMQIIAFFALGILFYFLMYALLRRFILKRLENLNRIISKNKLHQHVKIEGDDEVSDVTAQINRMMDALHKTENMLHQQFEKPNDESPFDEKETTLFHNYINQLAHYDSLTGFPNRIFFNEILNKSLNHARRHNKILSLLLIDIDGFTKIKTTLGEDTSKAIIKEVSKRLSATVRSSDTIARLGGEEFIILSDIPQPKFAAQIAQNILQACSQKIQIEEKEIYITLSIGICIFPHNGSTLEDLEKNCDIALYKAKHSGGNCYIYFNHEMTLEAHAHIQINDALRNAISNNEFVLYYQPKLHLSRKKITSVEALIRWMHPEYGIISPESFIPKAEDSGLIIPIGEWSLREACRACKSWHDQGYTPIRVSVNISPKQFAHQDIVGLVTKVLDETGLPPEFLELEITETTVMENVEVTAQKLSQIKQMGVKISIDDFGSGYTSISYFKEFPVDILKIDQSFIKGLLTNKSDRAITNAIIALGHSLNMLVVGEGVETVEQLRYLAQHGCDLIQGYYFCSPLPEERMLLQMKSKRKI